MGIHPTQEERDKIVKLICNDIANNITIASACKSRGVSRETFRKWVKKIGEYGILFKRAKEVQKNRENHVRRKRAKALVDRVMKPRKVIKKKFAHIICEITGVRERVCIEETETYELGNLTAAIFVLKSTDPDYKENSATGTKGEKPTLDWPALGIESTETKPE